MKCPIPYVYRSQPSAIVEAEMRDCLKGECAWWGTYVYPDGYEMDCCSIDAIALALTDMLRQMVKGGCSGDRKGK